MSTLMSERQKQIYRAQVYEWGGMYDKMMEAIQSIITIAEFEKSELEEVERQLLSSCIKHKVNSTRNSFRKIIEEKLIQSKAKNEMQISCCDDYIKILKKRLQTFLNSIDTIIDRFIINSDRGELYKAKLIADNARYRLEIDIKTCEDVKKLYEDAYKLSQDFSDPSDALVLSVVLNFAVFLAERCNDIARAKNIAKLACKNFDETIKKFDKLGDKSKISEATLKTLETLKEHINTWI
ncbi:14-3-3 family protein [Cryptosporidium muris RN66]|uniref:14-3-3 family protein n=1 Tax=Cryptosporidium muris (strain RN66) TaxID=441375 RepID=B6AFS7_CRYMR|nr:14-3-3 family protein [Cryptosporidium muris RN66]EEA07068.1 14-3-3 family protein [Cryptosporidium muris RN66]|eukprot:XP_002141417.1 14-3-3 family protein [Cryptosporidium muris RN66]